MIKDADVLEEVERIAEEILSKSLKDQNGIYWETLDIDKEQQQIVFDVKEDLYFGCSGITLFFLELYKYTQQEKYLNIIKESCGWLKNKVFKQSDHSNSFYTGSLGISYLFMQVYQTTKEERYLSDALTIAKSLSFEPEQYKEFNELLNGLSGVILGFLHLYHVSKDKVILSTLDSLTQLLIQQAHLDNNGIYWDKNSNHIRGLCGFSHGTGGIGFVLLELGIYFNNPALTNLGELAYQYENDYFDEEKANWPDFRSFIFNEESYQQYRNALLNNDFRIFERTDDMVAWCHGSPGIGLARLRAYALTGKSAYLKDIEKAITKTKQYTIDSTEEKEPFILCHGTSGNALLFLEAYQVLGEKKHLDLTQKIVARGLHIKSENGRYYAGLSHLAGEKEDINLFLGNAGIGYFYLKYLSREQKENSILLPYISENSQIEIHGCNALTISKKELNELIFGKHFPRTSVFGKRNCPEIIKQIDSIEQITFASITDYFENIGAEQNNNSEMLLDIFALEKQKLSSSLDVNKNYLALRYQYVEENSQNLLSLTDEELLETSLTLNYGISTLETKWNWPVEYSNEELPNLSEDEEKLIQVLPTQTDEFTISSFAAYIFDLFNSSSKVNDVFQQLLTYFEATEKDEEEMIKNSLLNQVRAAIQAFFLHKPIK